MKMSFSEKCEWAKKALMAGSDEEIYKLAKESGLCIRGRYSGTVLDTVTLALLLQPLFCSFVYFSQGRQLESLK